MNVELDEDCTMSDWEAVLELDEALAGWLLQGPARGEWGCDLGWATSDLQDPEWDTEDVPAVSCEEGNGQNNVGKLGNVVVWDSEQALSLLYAVVSIVLWKFSTTKKSNWFGYES